MSVGEKVGHISMKRSQVLCCGAHTNAVLGKSDDIPCTLVDTDGFRVDEASSTVAPRGDLV